jgi:hypothetical protein
MPACRRTRPTCRRRWPATRPRRPARCSTCTLSDMAAGAELAVIDGMGHGLSRALWPRSPPGSPAHPARRSGDTPATDRSVRNEKNAGQERVRHRLPGKNRELWRGSSRRVPVMAVWLASPSGWGQPPKIRGAGRFDIRASQFLWFYADPMESAAHRTVSSRTAVPQVRSRPLPPRRGLRICQRAP